MHESINKHTAETENIVDAPSDDKDNIANDVDKANEVFATLGIDPTTLTIEPGRRAENAAILASEADSLGFTQEGDDTSAHDQARRLLDDYIEYADATGGHGYTKAKELGLLPDDYGDRIWAKKMLLRSSARDIARRAGMDGSVLDKPTLFAISAKTGVNFSQFHQGYPILWPEERPQPAETKRKEDSHYAGPIGSVIEVSGVGSAVIVGYDQYLKPMVRKHRDGPTMQTFGRPR